jgi:phosphoserine phosphatase
LGRLPRRAPPKVIMSRSPPFDVICFDCDSTLTRIEGIDELAVKYGCVRAVEPLTSAAMDGSLSIEEVYARRLELIKPDAAALAWVGRRYVDELVYGARETIGALHARGKSVHVVSGGLLAPVRHLALELGISAENVHAVDVWFRKDGTYLDFDQASPLCRANGKAVIVAALAARFGRIALVGDGITDLEARNGGASVVGFGGVVSRTAVLQGADVFIAGPSLRDTLPALLTPEEFAAF